MRHNVAVKKLNRDTPHRKAMLRNLSDSLILQESITTTLARAKALRPYVEKVVTKAKNNKTYVSQNRLAAKLATPEAARKLFEDIAGRFAKREGGYTRIVKLPRRDGDKAPMARIEFVEEKKNEQ